MFFCFGFFCTFLKFEKMQNLVFNPENLVIGAHVLKTPKSFQFGVLFWVFLSTSVDP